MRVRGVWGRGERKDKIGRGKRCRRREVEGSREIRDGQERAGGHML